jgi:hypothetical protein
MIRTTKKQTKADFQRRVKSVDPAFARFGDAAHARDTRKHRPFLSLMAGGIWVYLMAWTMTSYDQIKYSLTLGNIDPSHHGYVFAALAFFLIISLVAILGHAYRFAFRKGASKSNSGRLLTGAICGLAVFYTPSSVWQNSMDLAQQDPQVLFTLASAKVNQSISLSALPFGALQ